MLLKTVVGISMFGVVALGFGVSTSMLGVVGLGFGVSIIFNSRFLWTLTLSAAKRSLFFPLTMGLSIRPRSLYPSGIGDVIVS